MEDVFDQNYVPVPGTNPQLYRSRISDWADRNWRPIIDSVVEAPIVSSFSRVGYDIRKRSAGWTDLGSWPLKNPSGRNWVDFIYRFFLFCWPVIIW